MKASNAFVELDFAGAEYMPELVELTIVSGGARLFGYLLKPDKRYSGPYPTVIVAHGFPGHITNNDLEHAFLRMGCVVIHMNARGAWGSEGNYLFPNLKEDVAAVANWAREPSAVKRFGIDADNIFLVGHSMGGMAVLNAAKELPFIKGVAALAPYDIDAAFRATSDRVLQMTIQALGTCLRTTSLSDVFENARANRQELSLCANAEKLLGRHVLLVSGTLDTLAPFEVMQAPLAKALDDGRGLCERVSLDASHSFFGQRMKLAVVLGEWIEKCVSAR